MLHGRLALWVARWRLSGEQIWSVLDASSTSAMEPGISDHVWSSQLLPRGPLHAAGEAKREAPGARFDRDGVLLSTLRRAEWWSRGRFSGQQRQTPCTSELLGYRSLAGARPAARPPAPGRFRER